KSLPSARKVRFARIHDAQTVPRPGTRVAPRVVSRIGFFRPTKPVNRLEIVGFSLAHFPLIGANVAKSGKALRAKPQARGRLLGRGNIRVEALDFGERGFHHVQPSDGFEPVAQVAQHEFEQTLSVVKSVLRFAAGAFQSVRA